MDRNAARVRTFEFVGTPDKVREAQWACGAERRGGEILGVEAGMRILNECLGRELAREEARGRRCCRYYENQDGELIYVRLFDETGAYEGEYHFYGASLLWLEIDAPYEIVRGEYVEMVYTKDIFDIGRHMKDLIKDPMTLRFEEESHRDVYQRIPGSRFDIYLKDPACTYSPPPFSRELSLYDVGFKIFERSGDDPDGVVRYRRRHRYDEQGAPLRIDRSCGAPWGEEIPAGYAVWTYDLERRVATFQDFEGKPEGLFETERYQLDRHGRIIERKTYRKETRAVPNEVRDKDTPSGLVYVMKRSYGYDNDDRLNDIRTVDFRTPDQSERTVYEYGRSGQLACEKDFNIADELLESHVFERLPKGRIKRTVRYYPSSNVYHLFQCGSTGK